jgi:hypothetical protein
MVIFGARHFFSFHVPTKEKPWTKKEKQNTLPLLKFHGKVNSQPKFLP